MIRRPPLRSAPRLTSAAVPWLLVAMVLVCTRARAAEDSVLEDLRQGDRVRLTLTHGGELVGHVTAWVGDQLSVRDAERVLVQVDPAVIEQVEVLERIAERPLARVDVPALETEEGRRELRRRRVRAGALATGSFFIPGLGQYAAGKPGLGSLYLFGTLVIDATIVLTLVINEDPLVATLLGGLELASRITSASLAHQDAMRLQLAILPIPKPGGGAPGWCAAIHVRW